MARASKLLADGSSVKETAGLLGYMNQHHFSRHFKKYPSHCPSAHAAIARSCYEANSKASTGG
ncbi:MAG: Helix-turn-helix domain protein [Verrucomicrobia bacterium ADurb.Bin118]|jgi:AraC-like DNA-binding protein|nr:MAG: Helix-turn-helix domain protein [Verrucomicrobia bacterium ADurb.Bin118]